MNPWHDARLLHRAANIVLALSLASMLAASLWWLSQRAYFDLRDVQIVARAGQSIDKVPDRVLRASALQRVHGNFFTVDLQDVRSAFEMVPWVRHASVRRVWPDGLLVELEEHRAHALWDDGRIVNTFGELFSANLGEAEESGPLPQLGGPPGTEASVARRFDELRPLLERSGNPPRGLVLSDRHAWTMKLADGSTLLLGREHGVPMERRLVRWAETYPKVKSELNVHANVIDLRYPNGFALRSIALLQEPEAETPAAPRKKK